MNHNGEISSEEFKAIVECLKDVGTYKFHELKMENVFTNVDTSKDGVVTKEEFLAGVNNHPELLELFNCRQILPVL